MSTTATEISHSNWFTRSIFHHNDTLIVLRLLRDLQYKQTPLSCLNIWCLILIVHKCQNQPVNSILTLFPAVFTYMSNDILLSNEITSD
ncbi:unnamed protein product [Rotaria socialis]|uniref:DZF domain-containing protein n=1 Tax=Rotaria socialis TaxID=392032 RepID=A0A818UGS5_9BILA|nr:unnamed protein product [Rotaria socialis]